MNGPKHTLLLLLSLREYELGNLNKTSWRDFESVLNKTFWRDFASLLCYNFFKGLSKLTICYWNSLRPVKLSPLEI